MEKVRRVLMHRPNNGMHPTANSAAFIRETWRYRRFVAPG
jgi:hypothetical protein